MTYITFNSEILLIEEIKTGIVELAKKYGVKAVWLFGSYARNEATIYSDIDILIEKGKIRSLVELIGFQQDVEKYFNKKVDVLTTESIKFDYFVLEELKKDALPLYDELIPSREIFADFMEHCYGEYNPFKVGLPEVM